MLGNTEYGYFTLPTDSKPSKAERMKKSEKEQRHVQTKRRERMLAALPMHARLRANDDTYSSNTQLRFTSIHLHPKVLDLCVQDKGGRIHLPHSIPHRLGLELSTNTPCSFTRADLIPNCDNGNYFPIPNYPISKAEDDTIKLESKFINSSSNDFVPIVSPPTTRSGNASLNNTNKQAKEIAEMKELLDRRMKELEERESSIRERENELIIREKQMQSNLEKSHPPK